MKTLTAIIERNEDSFYAYLDEIDGCVSGGSTYSEVKSNLVEIIEEFLNEDQDLRNTYKNGYQLKFEVSLQSVFELLPEVNISQLAKSGKLNPGLLRQYASGSKKASEQQAQKVMFAIDQLVHKLSSLRLTS